MGKLSDEELIQRIVRESILEYYGIIYDRYSKTIFNKCMLFTKDEHAAEDLMYDIFIKSFTSLSNFKNNSDFSVWFLSLTYNMSVDCVKRQYSNRKINYPEVETFENKRIEVVHSDAEKKLLDLNVDELTHILHKLYPEDRVILLMYYQDELPIAEIAQRLNINTSTAEKRLIRARERAIGIYPNVLANQKHNNTPARMNNFLQLAESRNAPPWMKAKLMSSVKIIHLVLYGMDLFINKPLALMGALVNNGNHNN